MKIFLTVGFLGIALVGLSASKCEVNLGDNTPPGHQYDEVPVE